jgi:hypothetical protein
LKEAKQQRGVAVGEEQDPGSAVADRRAECQTRLLSEGERESASPSAGRPLNPRSIAPYTSPGVSSATLFQSYCRAGALENVTRGCDDCERNVYVEGSSKEREKERIEGALISPAYSRRVAPPSACALSLLQLEAGSTPDASVVEREQRSASL